MTLSVVEVQEARTEVTVQEVRDSISTGAAENFFVEVSGAESATIEVQGSAPDTTVLVSGAVDIVTAEVQTIVPVEIAMGIETGTSGGGVAVTEVYVQDTAPVVAAGQDYLWWQTGLAPGGTGFTLWFSDGTP